MGVQPISIPSSLATALQSAGSRSGVDFDYLLQTAIRESSLNPEAKARTSSATGLFQFLEGTWLQVMKEQGPRLGYSAYADQIEVRGGDYVVRDSAKRAEILKLRENPQIAADLAAAFTRSNGDYLMSAFGRMPSPGELYIAHFLGAQGAERMFTAGLQNPDQVAVNLFPRQADANRSIFFDSSGKARTIRQVYQVLTAKHEGGGNAGFSVQQMAGQGGSAPQRESEPPLPSRFSREDMSFTGLFLNTPEPAASEETGSASNPAFFTQLYSQ
ncbi:MAG: lytic transglycosylase domain-containing protein [Devosia sp.]|uniref:transglycosylase SLT domain-containing protein n=1 Tax=Devosia sp. TaxID=1871048 RepID=UPI0024C7A5A8|nr:transglycosylase SLT domain-containing protein [Devosia sp.]UYO00564.1 MAG: lytic transglycosylase domain-containing protein [Devosia sp.]